MAEKVATIYEHIKYWAEKQPAVKAVGAPDTELVTYAQLQRRIDYIIKELNTSGLKKSDRVAIILFRSAEDPVVNLGIAAYATAVPLSPEHSLKEFAYYFQEFNIKAITVDENIKRGIIDLARERGMAVIKVIKLKEKNGSVFHLKVSARYKASAGKLLLYPGADDTAFVLHTSGTTARPKIVPLTHANVYFGARNIIGTLRLTSRDRCLNVMPLFHVHGLMVTIAAIYAGGYVVSTPKFNRNDFFHWLDECRPTWYTASAALQQAILSRVDEYSDIISKQKLRFIRSSSAPLPKESAIRLERIFKAPVAESYGMTEAALQITSQPLPPQKRKLGSVGKPAGPELKIINERGEFLAAGQVGEIVIRGANVIKAYGDNPAANRDCFLRGWLKTGDLGYVDKDGFVFISGRIKEMINKGGENISPREIDEALLRHPSVEQALVFSRPHPQLGEDIAAAVIMKKGRDFDEQGIKKFLQKEIADFKIPSRIVAVDELPRTGAGKLKRVGAYSELKQYFSKSNVKPKKEMEKKLVEIWAKVLDIDKNTIGIEDNFFELGGDSLRAGEIVRQMKKIGLEIGADGLLNHPTVKSLVNIIKSKKKS